MTEELIVFDPVTRITPEEVKKAVSAFFAITVISGLVGIYLFRKHDAVPVLVGAIGIASLLIGSMKRFPTRIVINTRLKIMKAEYFDAFGREKEMYVDLTKANISKKPRSQYGPPNENVVGIYQNIFNNFIKIDLRSHYNEEQLDGLFTLAKALKESGKGALRG